MLDKLGTIFTTALAVGIALVVIAAWLGEESDTAWTLWLAGGAVVAVALPLLLIVGGALLIRRLGRATGALTTPVEPAVPLPGWEGWQLTLDGCEHELWIPADGPARRVLLDGDWVRTRSWGRRRTTFDVAGHRAELVSSVDWATLVNAAPLVLADALLFGAAGEAPPMRYELLVDGTRRPATERRLFRRDGVAAAAPAGTPAVPPPGRHISLDPPS